MSRHLLASVAAVLLATSALPVASQAASPFPPPRLGSVELTRLADLNRTLRQTLAQEENRLESTCEFVAVRDRLIEVRDAAATAVTRLGALWLDGHFRNGGAALAEVLAYDLGAIVEDSRRDIAVADALALIESAGADAPSVARWIAAIHPDASCIARDAAGREQARVRRPR